jgi:hypothetical protein
MPKWKALILAILATMCTIVWLFSGQDLTFALVFALPAALFWSLWLYKHQRDQRIVQRAAAQWQRQPINQNTQTLPPMVSKGSNNHLFVPPPLN